MLGKLKKHDKGYSLIVDNVEIAIYDIERTERPLYSLSKKNCDEIFGVIDIEDLSKQAFPLDYNLQAEEQNYFERMAWKMGFQKALEILGNKKFSEEDVIKCVKSSYGLKYFSEQKMMDNLKSLKQTEWDVEVEMECVMGCQNLILNGENSVCCGDKKPKLDADGCLILKRK